jgi:hypothetical protein
MADFIIAGLSSYRLLVGALLWERLKVFISIKSGDLTFRSLATTPLELSQLRLNPPFSYYCLEYWLPVSRRGRHGAGLD